MICKMQISSSGIETQITVFIFYDRNHYTTSISLSLSLSLSVVGKGVYTVDISTLIFQET